MKTITRYAITLAIVAVAVGLLGLRYIDYLHNPWTRDGQVRANVIQIAPRVSGPIVELPIVDNQAVAAGDLLFRIDPRTYAAAVAEAEANLDRTIDEIEALAQQVEATEASVEQYRAAIRQAQTQVNATVATLKEATLNLERNRRLLETEDISQARFDKAERDYLVDLASKEQADAALASANSALIQAEANLAKARADLGAEGDDNARLRAARADLETARLNLEFTEVRATVDGLVTNLKLRLGSQAVANSPSMALIDRNSFWVEAYFRESAIQPIGAGDEAVITLMSYPDLPLKGRVDSLGWGIAQSDGSTGADLLPNVSPTFEWIRLAQRIPVKVMIEQVPEGVALRVGTTASVMVRADGSTGDAVPAPALLQ